ncbi:MAG TPA: YebC/PmpR family DNA-binding transcriptional regulator [Candidatus Limnocylindrales bacterium]|nr:YebC/PmpR family DNA-binding transcriptional regulator [Candidatus Limnocylindrales bacterium]
MSGHSKWSTIKRQKGVTDAKRSAVFTKVAREISVAARQGGGDPDANYRLRLAIEKARSVNMPADNIKRTIDKATGGGDAEQYEEIVYEGYGPGGVAVLVEAQTDNRNRTAAEVRSIFTKSGGQLAGSGAVAWQFEPRGLISVASTGIDVDADEVALAAIDAGAEDVDTDDDEMVEIYTSPGDLEAVRRALESAGIAVESAEATMIPKQHVDLDSSKARQALRLVELLEDLDDVQRVTANFEIPEDVFAEVAG